MRIFRNISLIFASLFLLQGCYMSQFGKGGRLDMSQGGYEELMPFSEGFEKALYRSSLSVNGHDFAGLMMIKSVGEGHYKIAFFSELGLNFFDLELRRISGKNKLNLYTHHIYEPLDKNILLNKFEKYFSMLLGPGPSKGENRTYLKKDEALVMVLTDAYTGKDGYLSPNLIEPYSRIVNMGGIFRREKISMEISAERKNHCPQHIRIEQPGFRLNMEMEQVDGL